MLDTRVEGSGFLVVKIGTNCPICFEQRYLLKSSAHLGFEWIWHRTLQCLMAVKWAFRINCQQRCGHGRCEGSDGIRGCSPIGYLGSDDAQGAFQYDI